MGEDPELEKILAGKLKLMKEASENKKEDSAADKPTVLTDETFKETVKNRPFVVVDCWASWCTPCRMIAPIIDELARDYTGRILFGKLDVDESNEVVEQYQVMSIPTLLIFKDGKFVDRIVGAQPRNMLESNITRHL